jgi:hypothetical protein
MRRSLPGQRSESRPLSHPLSCFDCTLLNLTSATRDEKVFHTRWRATRSIKLDRIGSLRRSFTAGQNPGSKPIIVQAFERLSPRYTRPEVMLSLFRSITDTRLVPVRTLTLGTTCRLESYSWSPSVTAPIAYPGLDCTARHSNR